MLPLKGIIFITFNLIRLISIVSLLVTFSAVIYLINEDSKAYYAVERSSHFESYRNDYYYFPDTQVATSTWGLFWLEFDRFNILVLCLVGVASELSFGNVAKVFNLFLPILGPSFSTAPLGIMQMIMSASQLSHYQEGFPLGAFWLLFFVGLINFLFGIAFRSQMKLRRSLFRSKRERVDEEKGIVAEDDHRLTKGRARKAMSHLMEKKSNSKRKRDSLLKHSPVQPISTPLDAFKKEARPNHTAQQPSSVSVSNSLVSASEMLRELARQENLRIEKEEHDESTLLGEYQWDVKRGMPIPKSPSVTYKSPNIGSRSTFQDRVKRGQAGMSRDLDSPRAKDAAGFKAAFQRRSLVLSKMVQQVKRGSGVSNTAGGKKKGTSGIPPVPVSYPKKLIVPLQGPSEWIEVERNGPSMQPPNSIHRPGRSTIYEDIGSEGGRSRYLSFTTPISDQYAYHAK